MTHLDLGGVDPDEIDRLLTLLSSTDVEECEIEQGDYRISLKRSTFSVPDPHPAGAVEQGQAEEDLFVTSPAVGVFYRSVDRGDARGVESGSKVKAGDVLGVIEVMGVPHPVRSTRDGVVGDFAVEDGEPVEYGQPIVAVSY